jgi:hypothetical protein
MNPDIEDFFLDCDTVHDVASVLKQYLRQLEVPLIPHSIQNVFIQYAFSFYEEVSEFELICIVQMFGSATYKCSHQCSSFGDLSRAS